VCLFISRHLLVLTTKLYCIVIEACSRYMKFNGWQINLQSVSCQYETLATALLCQWFDMLKLIKTKTSFLVKTFSIQLTNCVVICITIMTYLRQYASSMEPCFQLHSLLVKNCSFITALDFRE